jgi:hypothetical protein
VWQLLFDPLHSFDDVSVRLLENDYQDRLVGSRPAGLERVFYTVKGPAHR